MNIILLYLMLGIPLAILELVLVILIKDNASLTIKMAYALLCLFIWPLLIIVIFIPNKYLSTIRSTLKCWLT